MYKKKRYNSSIWKDRIRKPIYLKKGLEFQCLEDEDKNSSVFKNRAEFECLQWKADNNFNVSKNRAKIPMLREKGQNSNALRIRSENQSV